MPNTSTRIVLKKPKTDSSIRKVWLPKTLAYILREWKKSQDELKGFLGDEYQDFDLVVALPNGRPCEDRIILKEFAKLREDAGLPKVVFHSLRHSSTTYKLKLNHGDLKATQGDTGHAEIDMIKPVSMLTFWTRIERSMLRNSRQPSMPSLIFAMSVRRKNRQNRNLRPWTLKALWSSFRSRRSWRVRSQP